MTLKWLISYPRPANQKRAIQCLSAEFCIELSLLLSSSSTINSIYFALGWERMRGVYWGCSPNLGASSSLLSPAILFRLLYYSLSSSAIEECLLLMSLGVPSSATEKNRPLLAGYLPPISPPLLCWCWTDCLRFVTSRYWPYLCIEGSLAECNNYDGCLS